MPARTPPPSSPPSPRSKPAPPCPSRKVKRGGIGATKFHVARASSSTPTATSPHILKMIENGRPRRSRQAERHRRLPPPGRGRGRGPPGPHRKGALPRGRRRRFHRRHRRRLRGASICSASTPSSARRSTSAAARSTPSTACCRCPRPATARLLAGTPGLLARPGSGTDHAHRRGRGRHAGRSASARCRP